MKVEKLLLVAEGQDIAFSARITRKSGIAGWIEAQLYISRRGL